MLRQCKSVYRAAEGTSVRCSPGFLLLYCKFSMDPLSVAASIVALITAAASVLQHLEYVKSRMTPHAELLAIMNTVGTTRLLGSPHLKAIGNGSTSNIDRSPIRI